MSTALLVIVVVVVVAGIVIFLLRRGGDGADVRPAEKLPPAEEKPPKKKPAEARKDKEPAAPVAEKRPPKADRVEPTPTPAEPRPKEAPKAPAAEVQPPVDKPKRVPPADEVEALKKGLASTRGGFISRLAKLFGRKKEIAPELLDEIEEVLITADIGVKTTQKILDRLRERMARNELGDPDKVWEAIREEARTILGESKGGIALSNRPTVVLVVGVNGVGKTTTIGKLASRYIQDGRKVVLAAGDTFRAAAVLQLEVWGKRVGCEVVKGKDRADPSAVIFDAIKRGEAQGADVVIADTAGRLHTKAPLMEELKKVGRVVEKAIGRGPDETLLVLDATTGQNAIQQAQLFREALDVSGIALTKLDGTAKGGVILGIVDEHGIPVRYIGIGERVEDLREFDAGSFVAALFAKPDDESLAA
jgi:fused signal recognition particle receptor